MKHNFTCISLGLYDDIYECAQCGIHYTLSMDDPDSKLLTEGCQGSHDEKVDDIPEPIAGGVILDPLNPTIAEGINWEQRRWDAALASMQSIVSMDPEFAWSDIDIAKWSIQQADALIKAYKEKGDD